jgi:hydrogenase nickel incorporation protein HypA/HybF
MHELSLARAIVRTALEHSGGNRVVGVNLRVGALRQVVPDSLAFYFEVAARETPLEGARLQQEPVAALLRCPACAREWDPAPAPAPGWQAIVPIFRCPDCGAAGAETLRGGELEVESIEIEEESEACTAHG